MCICLYPGERLHKGLHGHYFLDHPPQLRASALFHAPGLDQHPSTLSSSQSPSGLGNLIEKHTSDAVLNRNHPSPPRPLKCVYLCRQPHIETHLAPLTTLFLSIQDAPGSSPADPLGCLYLSIQIGNVFLYVVAEAESPNSLRVPWFQPFLHFCVGSYIRGPPCFLTCFYCSTNQHSCQLILQYPFNLVYYLHRLGCPVSL